MKKEWTPKEIADEVGISKRAVTKRATRENWEYRERPNGRGGGATRIYIISDLPGDIQKAIILNARDLTSPGELASLTPGARLEAFRKMLPAQSFSQSASSRGKELLDPQQSLLDKFHPEPEQLPISPDVIEDRRVGDIVQIIQEAQNVPPGYKKSKWIQLVAIRYGKNPATIYRYIDRYDKTGLAGLKHRKRVRGKSRSWTPEAIDFWLGLVLKKEHRKISKESLYECLRYEAAKRNWKIGSYRSALWWLDKKLTPQLLALQRGGVRALDNTLPPICRDYSDLRPFEILVGDQHRFDRWVVDEETGEIFRPEGYFWQDLRTRCFYGGAISDRYNAYLMGLALRIGLRRFGSFGSIYTDHGKPEESKYIAGILEGMRSLGLGAGETMDLPADMDDAEPDEITCRIKFPGEHRKAIVRNAKAKMIEGTFSALEKVLRNRMRLPGDVKRLDALKEEQDVDDKEALALARTGKLLTFREFILAVYDAMDFYNNQRPHRGVLREWRWDPKPKQASPMQCLLACHHDDGWKPQRLPESAIDLVFLPRERRSVDRGRILFRKQHYEADALMPVKGKVDVRFDPIDPTWIFVFQRGKFICQADLMEYSSMKDRALALKKIGEKARRRNIFLQEYRALTCWVPDFREYSQVPAAERAAAIIGKAKKEASERARKEMERYRVRTPQELAEETRQIEAYRPPRPVFASERDRYQYMLDRIVGGEEISDQERAWMGEYEARMSVETRNYWAIYKDAIGMGE